MDKTMKIVRIGVTHYNPHVTLYGGTGTIRGFCLERFLKDSAPRGQETVDNKL